MISLKDLQEEFYENIPQLQLLLTHLVPDIKKYIFILFYFYFWREKTSNNFLI